MAVFYGLYFWTFYDVILDHRKLLSIHFYNNMEEEQAE